MRESQVLFNFCGVEALSLLTFDHIGLYLSTNTHTHKHTHAGTHSSGWHSLLDLPSVSEPKSQSSGYGYGSGSGLEFIKFYASNLVCVKSKYVPLC